MKKGINNFCINTIIGLVLGILFCMLFDETPTVETASQEESLVNITTNSFIHSTSVSTTVTNKITTQTAATSNFSLSTITNSITNNFIETIKQSNYEERITTLNDNLEKDKKEVQLVECKDIETSIVEEEYTEEIINEEFVVFKPTTHYVHTNLCYWYDENCYEITNTEDIEALYCTECNPNIEICNYYTEEVKVDNDDRELLAQIVCHEAGSDWIDTYDKAMIVAGVMNRVNDDRFPSTVYGVLTQEGQFSRFYPYCCTPTQSCYDAVDYYFNNSTSFGSHNSWWGDGVDNHFYYQ